MSVCLPLCVSLFQEKKEWQGEVASEWVSLNKKIRWESIARHPDVCFELQHVHVRNQLHTDRNLLSTYPLAGVAGTGPPAELPD